MSKYTAEQVEAEIASYAEEAFPREEIDLERVTAMLRDLVALLRERESAEPVAWMTHHDEPMLFPTEGECVEYCADDERPIPLYTHPKRESAKAAVTAQIRATACDAYDKEMVGHGETANPVAMRAALEAVAPMLASARVPDEKEDLDPVRLRREGRVATEWERGFNEGWNDCREAMLAEAPKPETEE